MVEKASSVRHLPTVLLLRLDVTSYMPVSYTHLRAHETPEHLVCRLLLEKKTFFALERFGMEGSKSKRALVFTCCRLDGVAYAAIASTRFFFLF